MAIRLTYDQIGRPGRPGPEGTQLRVPGIRNPIAWHDEDYDRWEVNGFKGPGTFELMGAINDTPMYHYTD